MSGLPAKQIQIKIANKNKIIKKGFVLIMTTKTTTNKKVCAANVIYVSPKCCLKVYELFEII